MYIGIIGAMEEEIEKIKSEMSILKEEKKANFIFYIGTLYGKNVIVVRSNEGKVNSAICTQTMILSYEVDMILNVGVAGSLTKALDIGGIALSKNTVEYDFDTTALGYDLGYTFGLNTVYVKCSEEVCNKIYNITKNRFNTVCGTVLSADKFVSDESTRTFLKDNFKEAIAVDMETASISHVCKINNIPFCGIRAISDSTRAEEYRAFVNIATNNLFEILSEYLQNM